MGTLLTVALGPLAQLFESTGDSGQVLRVSTQAQDYTEHIRGHWQSYPFVEGEDPADPTTNAAKTLASRYHYDRTCFSALPALSGMTYTLLVRNLDTNASETGTAAWTTDCASAAVPSPSVPIKRVSVIMTATDGSRSRLTLDVPRP